MSRRDTIIIAVLVNAGLLLVLFATAMRSNKKEEKKEMAKVQEEVVGDALSKNDPLSQTSLDGKSDPLLDALNESNDTLAFADEMEIPLTQSTIDAAPVTPVSAVPEIVTTPTPTPTPQPAPVTTQTTPTPSVEKAKDDQPTMISVTVKKGDALEKIARAHRSSVTAIMKANNLSNSNLKIGQVLKVPTNEKTAVAKKESAASSVVAKKTTGESEYYTVKEGDNPWLIASRNNVKLGELLKLNEMDETKARKLKPGDKLRIR